jgi:hypothetical protein
MSAGFVSTNVTVDPTRPPVQAIAPVGEVWTDVTTAAPGDTITVWARCSTATSGTGEPTWVTMGMSLMDPVGDLEDILTGEIVTGTNGTVSSDITFPDNATFPYRPFVECGDDIGSSAPGPPVLAENAMHAEGWGAAVRIQPGRQQPRIAPIPPPPPLGAPWLEPSSGSGVAGIAATVAGVGAIGAGVAFAWRRRNTTRRPHR